jgi:ABC-type antimicrobial peptide transport system permease subunit
MQVLPLDRVPGAHKEYYTALLQRIRTIPGISSAGLVDNFVLGGGTSYTGVSVAGTSPGVTVFQVMPGYFETIGATLSAGRLPTDADYASGFRGTVINESAARELFPDGPAVGREFTRAGGDQPWTVLGVIADLRHGGPLDTRNQNQPQVFFPFEPDENDLQQAMMIVLRPSDETPGLADELRRMAQSIGPRVLVERIRSADDWFGDRVITPRRRTVLLGLLGGLGLVLALVGVLGMTAYAVARRSAEIGVRMAFGARPGQVVQTIVRDAAVPIGAGTVLGVGGALLSTRIIESFLFETAPTDPPTLAAVAVTLATAACVAALVPALRAAKVDPASSLRVE